MNLVSKNNSIVDCARYAFRPNELAYCGPDKNKELLQYIESGLPSEALVKDGGLKDILSKFETLSPYLRLIANSNKENNIFSKEIIQSYWIGSDKLLNINKARFYEHLAEGLMLKKKLSKEELSIVKDKVHEGANPHHSFHVFNIWRRTGYVENPHTLFTMDECRIGWGVVIEMGNNILKVLYKPLVFQKGRLAFGDVVEKQILYNLPGEVKVGDWVSFHWSSYCEVLTEDKIYNLKKWTIININLANKSYK